MNNFGSHFLPEQNEDWTQIISGKVNVKGHLVQKLCFLCINRTHNSFAVSLKNTGFC